MSLPDRPVRFADQGALPGAVDGSLADPAAKVLTASLRADLPLFVEENRVLLERVTILEQRLQQRDLQRRALLHIMADLHDLNRRLSDQRKAMIHIMADLHETTLDLQRREKELRDKQEQLVQAGKMATLGELTTGIGHELNNPLNNIGLFIGNVIDQFELGSVDPDRMRHDLVAAIQQVRKATEIITHLRTFGRTAPASREPISISQVIHRALSLMHEQLRLRQIPVRLTLDSSDPLVIGNAIQLEQVFINLLTNARDALADAARKEIQISSAVRNDVVEIVVNDSGAGIPPGLEQRIFDPFFTTKDVGKGTGLGLSITYGIIKDHQGAISVIKREPGRGAAFQIELPLAPRSTAAQSAPE